MNRWEENLASDGFLSDVEEVECLVAAFGDALAVSPAKRDKLVREVRLEGRFDRFTPQVARMLDVDEDRARVLLDGIGRPESWTDGFLPNIRLYHVEGGPAVAGAITGFVRFPAGTVFPRHRHLGHEEVLLLQGSLVDDSTGQIHRAGELVCSEAETSHSVRARPGPGLLYLVVLRQGLEIGTRVFRADDPRF